VRAFQRNDLETLWGKRHSNVPGQKTPAHAAFCYVSAAKMCVFLATEERNPTGKPQI